MLRCDDTVEQNKSPKTTMTVVILLLSQTAHPVLCFVIPVSLSDNLSLKNFPIWTFHTWPKIVMVILQNIRHNTCVSYVAANMYPVIHDSCNYGCECAASVNSLLNLRSCGASDAASHRHHTQSHTLLLGLNSEVTTGH